MAAINLQYGTTTAATITLAALANAGSANSTAIDNTTNLFIDILLEVVVTVAAGATATGTVEIYAKGSIDNSDYDDDTNDKWIGTIGFAAAGAGTYKRIVPVAPAFGGSLPAYVQVRIRNVSGAALTSGTVSYRGVSMQST